MEKKESPYVGTKDLVGEEFTVLNVQKRKYRLWDSSNNKFLVSDSPKRDYQAFWLVETDKGQWSASAAQIGQLLTAVEEEGIADILDKTFSCDSNGKSGMEIRYFFDLVTN